MPPWRNPTIRDNSNGNYGILEPNIIEVIEDSTLNVGGATRSTRSCCSRRRTHCGRRSKWRQSGGSGTSRLSQCPANPQRNKSEFEERRHVGVIVESKSWRIAFILSSEAPIFFGSGTPANPTVPCGSVRMIGGKMWARLRYNQLSPSDNHVVQSCRHRL